MCFVVYSQFSAQLECLYVDLAYGEEYVMIKNIVRKMYQCLSNNIYKKFIILYYIFLPQACSI